MSSIQSCVGCRHNPEERHNFAGCGSDCADCKDYSNYIKPKRFDVNICAKCSYEDDPCHYLCVECQDANNFEQKPTLIKEIKFLIIAKKNELKILRNELKKAKRNGFKLEIENYIEDK